MRKIFIALTTITLVVAVNLGLAELALGVYQRKALGKWLWTRDTTLAEKVAVQSKSTIDIHGQRLIITPYLGALTRKGTVFSSLKEFKDNQERVLGTGYTPDYYWTLPVNDFGYWSPVDYPYQKKDDEYVIGIFGGSVAYHLWLSSMDERSPVFKHLSSETGKKIITLDFASGGLKQPQQLMTLTYMLSLGQKFDFILNLDGFNELYSSAHNVIDYKVHYSMPLAQYYNSIMHAFLLRSQSGDSKLASLIEARESYRNRRDTTHSAIVYTVADAAYRYFVSTLGKLEAEISNERKNLLYPHQLVPTDVDTWEKAQYGMADLWFRSSVNMKNLALANGTPYLHALQPNQYFSKKKFTEKEINDYHIFGPHNDLPFDRFVPMFYEAMLERSKNFQPSGVEFLDLTKIFEDSTETIWIDWCCHVNENGNNHLGSVIEDKMIQMIRKAAATHHRNAATEAKK